MATYTLNYYRLIGQGTYAVEIMDEFNVHYTVTTHDVDRIDSIRLAGRELCSNDHGTYKRLRDELAADLAAQIGLDVDTPTP